MSGVDVLAAWDAVMGKHGLCFPTQKNMDDLREARAAVAELMDAVAHENEMRACGGNAEWSAADKRLTYALARCKGAK